jgi:hypothetical protein
LVLAISDADFAHDPPTPWAIPSSQQLDLIRQCQLGEPVFGASRGAPDDLAVDQFDPLFLRLNQVIDREQFQGFRHGDSASGC